MTGRRALPLFISVTLAVACADKAVSISNDGGASGASAGGVSGSAPEGGSANPAGAAGTANSRGGANPSGGANTSGGSVSGGVAGTVAGASVGGASGAAGAGTGANGGAGANGGVAGTAGADPGGGGAGANGGTSSGRAGGGAAGGGRAGSSGSTGAGGSVGVPFKGIANSPCNVRTALGTSWYYNWTQSADSCATGGEFVPMIWGHLGAEQTGSSITNAVATFVARGYQNVLAFNEPDNPSQSNIPVNTAISLFPSFDNPAIRVGTPGTAANANPGQAWFSSFMTMLNANGSLRADFLAIHWYGWNAGSCNATASELESYLRWAENFAGNRPIWITEWGCLNLSAPSTATVVTFYEGALAMFARHPRVVRYAWYPFSTNCEVANSDGSLTELGRAYAAAPAFK